MADIVRTFEDYCELEPKTIPTITDGDARLGAYYFSYGTRSVQNLLTNPDEFCEDKVHVLLEPVRRKSEISSGGLSIKSRLYSSKYLLVWRDNYDKNYFNEKGTDQAESKYSTRIEPMLPVYAALEKQFIACEGLELVQHDNIDITDALDANLTGLVCTFQFRAYE